MVDDCYGQLGISSKGVGKSYTRPRLCSFNIVIQDISCGDEHTALVTSMGSEPLPMIDDGFVYTMGNNMNGRLGIGDNSLTHSPVPCLVEGLVGQHILRVSCGWTHTAAVSGTFRVANSRAVDQGLVFTWGLGEFGALGQGDTSARYVPAKVESISGVALVACGSRHTAFVSGRSMIRDRWC